MNEMQRRWAEWFILRSLQVTARNMSEYEQRTAELYDLARRHPNRFIGYYLTAVLDDLRIENKSRTLYLEKRTEKAPRPKRRCNFRLIVNPNYKAPRHPFEYLSL